VQLRKSKLEQYEDLMGALVDKYLTVDSLAYMCSMECVAVSQRLDFLIENGLIQQKRCSNKVLYALTKRGLTVYRTLTVTRRLEKLKSNIRMMDEALQAIPSLPENTGEPPSRPR
jgi:predicted transcriptional regulator